MGGLSNIMCYGSLRNKVTTKKPNYTRPTNNELQTIKRRVTNT